MIHHGEGATIYEMMLASELRNLFDTFIGLEDELVERGYDCQGGLYLALAQCVRGCTTAHHELVGEDIPTFLSKQDACQRQHEAESRAQPLFEEDA